MKKMCLSILMIICGILTGITGLFTVMCLIVLDPVMILTSGLITAIFVLLTRKCYRSIKDDKVKEEKNIEEKVDDINDFKQEKEEPKKEKPAKERVTITDRINAKLDEWNEKLDKKIAEGTDENGEYHISEKTEKRAAFAGKVIGVLICIGMVVGGIALIVLLFNVLGAVIGFLINAFMYVIGFIAAIFIIGGFLSFWWDLVKWEHVYKPRGYVRVKIRRRR